MAVPDQTGRPGPGLKAMVSAQAQVTDGKIPESVRGNIVHSVSAVEVERTPAFV